ncbi:MAG: BatA domain-containing protein [Planctomycetota bacterium]
MFLYPALIAGFAFVAVPLLVHLINMLRHQRRRWAAMDFLLSSYRKQKRWLRLRQFLLLLCRIAVAATLVAMLCGWTGGRQILDLLGGRTTHHVFILDDSYSMGDTSGGGETSAYRKAIGALEQLTQRLVASDGNHQLTVMRASRASLAAKAGSASGDAAADLAAQTLATDSSLIARVVSTDASAIRTDLVAALELAGEMASSTPSDDAMVYIASDFRSLDWATPDRLAEAMQSFSRDDVSIRMIDCASQPQRNLAVTSLEPVQDVWVAGVPVVVRASVKNYSSAAATNVSLSCRVVRYGDSVVEAIPGENFSGEVDSLPSLVFESVPPGGEVTKSFQVFVSETGTHAIEVRLPSDALAVDNVRACTLPLTDVEKVLVIDSDSQESNAYTLSAVLDPGSQVRIGAVPDIKPPGYLRSVTAEMLSSYRAVYLIDLPELNETAAIALEDYVRRGGGLAWFLGENVSAPTYNDRLWSNGRSLLPRPLDAILELPPGGSARSGDVLFGDRDTLLEPLLSAGDAILSLIGLEKSWKLQSPEVQDDDSLVPYRTVLKRRDGSPLVTQHELDSGTVVTVLTGLESGWTNWTGDPTFVPFLLLTNARLWSGASAETSRRITDSIEKRLSIREYFPEVKLISPASTPPRVVLEWVAESENEDTSVLRIDPVERLIESEANVDDLLRPGVYEWSMLKADGGGRVVPEVATIDNGEGDLARVGSNDVRQALLPIEVDFLTSEDWGQQNSFAGTSSVGLMLLALLGLLLAAEQALAYWASYHTGQTDRSTVSGRNSSASIGSTFGLSARPHVGRSES